MVAKLWHIYLVKKPRHTKGRRKRKYVVIALIDANPMGFYINSEVSRWVEARPKFLACEANITADEHPVLEYDSIVDCQTIYQFFESELTATRDKVSAGAKREILNAIRDCPKLEKKYKDAILTREGLI